MKYFIAVLVAALVAVLGVLSYRMFWKSDDSGSGSGSIGKVDLEWCYGGTNGSKAKEDPAVKIKNLNVNSTGMSYSWESGSSLKPWGISDKDPKAIACIFYKDGSKYKGGKFEWISASRKTREFGNIKSKYNGWEPDKFFAAKEYAFCIASSDGKKRSNIIVFKK